MKGIRSPSLTRGKPLQHISLVRPGPAAEPLSKATEHDPLNDRVEREILESDEAGAAGRDDRQDPDVLRTTTVEITQLPRHPLRLRGSVRACVQQVTRVIHAGPQQLGRSRG